MLQVNSASIKVYGRGSTRLCAGQLGAGVYAMALLCAARASFLIFS